MIKVRHYTIAITLLIAMVFQIIPVPVQLDLYRPDWVLIVLSYWVMALPHRANGFLPGIIKQADSCHHLMFAVA